MDGMEMGGVEWDASRILSVLDACGRAFWFPILDNGYIYPAASRLTLFRSATDWALTIEVFGYMNRAMETDLTIYAFGSRLRNRKTEADFARPDAFTRYLAEHPHDESGGVVPIARDDWAAPYSDDADPDRVDSARSTIRIRDQTISMPSPDDFPASGVTLSRPPNIQIYELCRVLASTHRGLVLATDDELREHIPTDLEMILRLDDWHHPEATEQGVDVSGSETFRQLADVLATGDISHYRPTLAPNTHWRHWPGGGSL